MSRILLSTLLACMILLAGCTVSIGDGGVSVSPSTTSTTETTEAESTAAETATETTTPTATATATTTATEENQGGTTEKTSQDTTTEEEGTSTRTKTPTTTSEPSTDTTSEATDTSEPTTETSTATATTIESPEPNPPEAQYTKVYECEGYNVTLGGLDEQQKYVESMNFSVSTTSDETETVTVRALWEHDEITNETQTRTVTVEPGETVVSAVEMNDNRLVIDTYLSVGGCRWTALD